MIRSAAVVALLLLLGRMAGFLREWVLAQTSGASDATDIAIVLLTFPDLVVNLLLAGGLAAALVPAFKRLPPGADIALMLKAAAVVGAAFALFAGVLSLAASPVLAALAPGLAGRIDDQTVSFFRLTNIALPLGALSGVAVSFLNAREQFAIGAAGTLVFNLVVIGFIVTLGQSDLVGAIAFGVVGGALARLLMQAAPISAQWVRPDFGAPTSELGLVGRFVGAFGFVSFLSLMPPIARAFASTDEAGALSLFSFAHKIIELPMALVIGAITTVMLPRIAGLVVAGKEDAARTDFGNALRVSFLIMLAIAIPAAVYAETMMRIVFFSSPFTEGQRQVLGALAAIGLVALPIQGVLMVYGTGFAALGRTRPLIWAGALMLGSMVAFAIVIPSSTGVQGVMVSYSLALAIGTVFLSFRLWALFKINILVVLGQRGFASILVPAAGSLAVALAGKAAALPVLGEFIFAALAFLVFVGLHLLLDEAARNAVAGRLLKRPTPEDGQA